MRLGQCAQEAVDPGGLHNKVGTLTRRRDAVQLLQGKGIMYKCIAQLPNKFRRNPWCKQAT
eukprot:CAMPEP_0202407634 /NCGR_PEP_ID=MMETSP1128-20130828/12788_1 /ASSEMBLY_ACC=CAM_ASM_000463 /TAXON_ID=3047 /ORGANISM="Dunaliella tertiolecta, Strain CCMP1320" /LENGTH=60 /DNA_ID=CAMNT_0049012653 /DNA_START=307 /DNA_END=489 /DNA_ORIENTATION=-